MKLSRYKCRGDRRGAVAVEAAVVLPVLLVLMMGIWELGRFIQVDQILVNAAREGARLAAGGYINGTPVTSAQTTQAVRDYMTAAGLPAAAVSGAQVNLVCLANPTWTNPSDALPLDKFRITVVIPSGTAFNSLRWNLLNRISSFSSISVSADWQSLNNTTINVDAQLPYSLAEETTMKSIKQRHRRLSRRAGAVTVETALVLPLVLMFLFGIYEYGRYVMMLQVLTNAAREGAHYAVTHTQPITIGGTTKGNATTDVTAAVNKALAGQALTGQNIQVYTSDSLGNNLGTWTNAQFGQCICVRITGNYSVIIASMLKLPSTVPVTAQSVMRSESN